jgi:DNA polymerase-3 subunit epsilon
VSYHPLPTSDKTAASLSTKLENTHFSVVDVETTGLFPERDDRIIEIAIVRINFAGAVIDQYTTLINPNRDLGPTPIHGITGREVRNAPAFGEIAGDVLLRLGGAVFTGYNASFDYRFLCSEMRRIRHDLPDSQLLCVMQLASRVAPTLTGRKLEVCCRHFNVPLADAHSACCDASATAKVLCECFKKMKSQGNTLLNGLAIEPLPRKEELWPYLPVTGKSFLCSDAAVAAKSEVSYIEKLVASLPLTANRDPPSGRISGAS